MKSYNGHSCADEHIRSTQNRSLTPASILLLRLLLLLLVNDQFPSSALGGTCPAQGIVTDGVLRQSELARRDAIDFDREQGFPVIGLVAIVVRDSY
jgi:hypothetical protein